MDEIALSKVYVKVDDSGRVIRCEGGYTTQADLSGWIKIDEGTGDRYNLCQSHYFEGGLYTEDGIPRYKLVDGAPVLRTEEELQADRPDPLPQAKADRQAENKTALASWLAVHPLTWVDGNTYGVTEEDQSEMALNLQQYQLQVAAGREVELEWHTQKKMCHTFTQEQYTALSLAIIDYVYPYLRYQEAVKEAIYGAQTVEEVAAVLIDYASVEASS